MKTIRVACCLTILLLALLAFAFSTSTTTRAQGPLPCTPVAQGNGSQTCTVNFKDEVMTFPVPSSPCNPAGTITQTFNGVFHITINKAGDVWDTGTMTGPFVLVPDDPSIPTYTGHATTWFGDSLNNQNSVTHFTMSAHATAPNAPALNLHETFHMSTSASGTNPPLVFDKVMC